MKTPYIILSQETEEDALELAGRFTSLDAASSFIQQYWQDVDHIINKHSFCTDYAAYTLVGFWLEDIGSFVKEPGTNWECYFFGPVSEEGFKEAYRIIYIAPLARAKTLEAVRECYSETRWPGEQQRRICDTCGSRDLEWWANGHLGPSFSCRSCGIVVLS
jgi:hypothetical protein